MLINRAATRDAIHQLFDAVDAISVQGYDEDRRVIYWNTGSKILYGYSEAEALGKKLEDLIIPEHMRESLIVAHQNWLDHGVKIPSSGVTLRTKSGEDANVFSSHVLFVDEQKKRQMYCVDIDLSEVRQAKAQVVFKENMLKAVFEATPDIFFLTTEDGEIIEYQASANARLYVERKKFVGRFVSDLLPETASNQFETHVAKVMMKGGVSIFEYEIKMPHGPTYFEARISHLKAHKQVVIIVRDITEQHKSAEIIRQQAYYDTLTLLPNRFLSLDRLSQMLKEAKRGAEKTAVLFLDLDDFKKVNDSLGHEVGDKLLVETANRLKLAVRESTTVGRLGGDEFIVLLQKLADNSNAIGVAENLLGIFREPFRIDGRELILTLSIGIAIYPDDGECASDLLRNADSAMYEAKALGRNAYSFFTREMNNIMVRRLEIEGQMHSALERGEFEVHYQPKFNVKDGAIVGAEALLRWRNPVLGNVTPDEFIPIAEHTGLIVALGKYVVRQALNFLSEWQNVNRQEYSMAVNLSPRQFRDKDLIEFIQSSLCEASIAAGSLEFEITEGVLMIGKSYIDGALSKLHGLGIKLSMDDFGTGYSSLSYLRQYAFDVLKVDRSFIDGITLNKEDRDLVKATIAMAHSLDLLVVAEGVETREQLVLLDELGCDLAQGYYFSKPIPAKEMMDFRYFANR